METPRRGSDGRRIFTAGFKREQMARVAHKALTLAGEPSVVRRWKHRSERRSQTAVAANEDVVPASALRAAHQRHRENIADSRAELTLTFDARRP